MKKLHLKISLKCDGREEKRDREVGQVQQTVDSGKVGDAVTPDPRDHQFKSHSHIVSNMFLLI